MTNFAFVELGNLYKEYESPINTKIYLQRLRQFIENHHIEELPPRPKSPLWYAVELLDYIPNKVSYKIIDSMSIRVENENDNALKAKWQKEIVLQRKKLFKAKAKRAIGNLASDAGNLSWYLLFNRKFSEAENAAKEALFPDENDKSEGYDKKVEWINSNLALSLLFQGKYAEAEKIYLSLKDKSYNNSTYKNAFLADLEELEKAGITHPDVAKVRALLNK